MVKFSELLEKKKFVVGSIFFYWGLLCVIGGYFMGILILEVVYIFIGILEYVYYKMVIGVGLLVGIVVCIGFFILMYRRLFDKRICKISLLLDIFIFILLLFMMLLGVVVMFFNIDLKGFDYWIIVGLWFREIFLFSFDVFLMESVLLWFKFYIMIGYIVFILWLFIRLVYVFSLLFKYLI